MSNPTNSSKSYDTTISPTLLDSRNSVSHSLSLAFMITKELKAKIHDLVQSTWWVVVCLAILTNFLCCRLAKRFGGHQGEHLRKVCVCIEPRYFSNINNRGLGIAVQAYGHQHFRWQTSMCGEVLTRYIKREFHKVCHFLNTLIISLRMIVFNWTQFYPSIFSQGGRKRLRKLPLACDLSPACFGTKSTYMIDSAQKNLQHLYHSYANINC